MKASIHPQFIDSQVVCACGNTFTTKSLKPSIMIDVCSKCHPFFTGEHRFIDTRGRVEDFQKRQKFADSMRSKLAEKKAKKLGKKGEGDPKSLKELLAEM